MASTNTNSTNLVYGGVTYSVPGSLMTPDAAAFPLLMTPDAAASPLEPGELVGRTDLVRACADFYLLECIVAETQEPATFTGQRVTSWKLRAEGTDTRSELRALQVRSDFEDLTDRLAAEMAAYLDRAIGGELRHAPQEARCDHDCKDDNEGCSLARCGCGDEACEAAGTDCQHECDKYCSGSLERPKVLASFLGRCNRHTDRDAAWAVWDSLKGDRVPYLVAAQEVFEWSGWSRSYGGPQWASTTGLLVSYLRGEMTARTFVDRCWSVQHNSGPIFDKCYVICQRVDFRGELVRPGLQELLDAQERDDYATLAAVASIERAGYWREHHRSTRQHPFLALAEMRGA